MNKISAVYSVLVTLALLYVLAACSHFDGASIEQAATNLHKLRMSYCSEAMHDVREVILFEIHKYDPGWKPLCDYIATTPIV